jgi:hypothetical protein
MMMIPMTTVIIRPAEIHQVALVLKTFVTALKNFLLFQAYYCRYSLRTRLGRL